MKIRFHFPFLAAVLGLFLPTGLWQASAATTIISTVPVNGANGVSPSAPVVFHFSTAMDPTMTGASFLDDTAGSAPPVIPVWSSGNTVLTCTPSPQFANSHTIEWSVSGQDAIGNPLTGTTSGTFTNVAGVNGGSGTNANTTFVIGEYALFGQSGAAPPTLITFEFFPEVLLASNRSASNITVTLPTAAVTNLSEDQLRPEQFDLAVYKSTAAALNSNYPAGSYTFAINPASLNQQVTVTLPAFAQPNAPQVVNYTAAQSVDSSQPFTLNWNTFTNGGSADLVLLLIPLSDATTYSTPTPGQPGALTGTAASFTIPAHTLQAGANYTADLIFYHYTLATNSGLVSYAFVGTGTGFNLSTIAASTAPQLTINHSGNNVILSWPTSATGYNLYATTSLSSPSWQAVSPAPVTINTNYVVTNAISANQKFYRLSNP